MYAVGYPILSVYIKIKVTGAAQYDHCLEELVLTSNTMDIVTLRR
jgi:hypothetical protein